MPTIKDTAATSALNEDKYINKLYDESMSSQKNLLDQNMAENNGVLDQEKQNVQKQTDDNLQRTYVEAAKAAGVYSGPGTPKISGGAAAQAGLSQWNQQAADTTALKGKQNEADMEIERQRQLLASQYSAAIKQAQADNDMQRAQQLYEAAKAEEAHLMEYRKQAATMLAGMGDNSIMESIANGEAPARDTESDTWKEVLKNEDTINRAYDSQMESQKQGLLMDYQKSLSDLGARLQQQQKQTDESLTQAYVDSLRGAKNYGEAQNAYGLGSGTQAQAQLARDMALQKNMTDIRGVQAGKAAQGGVNRFAIGQTFRDAIAKANAENEANRVKALFDAAEQEEQTLADNQEFVGKQYAKNGDYSILGKLYGLTQDQIDRMQGTGAYAYTGEPSAAGGMRRKFESAYTPTEEDLIRDYVLKDVDSWKSGIAAESKAQALDRANTAPKSATGTKLKAGASSGPRNKSGKTTRKNGKF